MQFLNSMDRKNLTIGGLILAGLFLFFLNILSSGEIKTAQIDLTQDKLFTLSEGTKKVIGEIDEPIKFRYYFSKKFGEISPVHGQYGTRVRELLQHYERVSGGKIDVDFISPDPFSVEEDEAVKAGIQAVPLDQTGEQGYFGLAATNSTDDRKTIAFFDPRREQFLEYDLTRIIFDLAKPKKKKVGLMTSLLMEADPMLGYQPWPLMAQMNQFFEVVSLQSDVTEIPEDIDVLLVIHPKFPKDSTLYAIDQYLMRGGKAVLYVDPQNETARISPQQPPGMGTSELKMLFDAYGIEYDNTKFVGDRTAAVRVSAQVGGRDVIADYLSWNVFQNRNFNLEDVVTANLNTISVASAGHIGVKEDSGLQYTPLVQTSIMSQAISTDLVQGEINPEAILRQYQPDNKQYTIAARISGKLKSAFPDGPPPAEKDDDKEAEKVERKFEHAAESKSEVNLIVFGDSDQLTSRFWIQEQDFFGQKISVPVSNNADFLVNALDNLSGSGDLISLRSRGLSVRPFYRIIDLQNAAEDRYRATEQELTAKLEDLQKKLSGLKVDENRESGPQAILTSAQRKAFDQFRGEMLQTRKELRDVQHALREDIEQLDTILKILNIWAVPVLVALLAIVLAFFRRRKYRQQVAQG